MADPPLLAISNLTKVFGGQTVLDRLDFRLRAGERRGIIGPNGAGKSTLIDLITGRQRPDAGRIQFRGLDVTALPVLAALTATSPRERGMRRRPRS